MNPVDIVFRDKFGNRGCINELKDGGFHKTTHTNRYTHFEFLDKKYSIRLLNAATIEKVYWEKRHSERKLVKDRYGRLFHYCFEEVLNYDGGADREDYLWILVSDEKDSDHLSSMKGISLLRPPFVEADESEWTAAHNIINNGIRKQKRARGRFRIKLWHKYIKPKIGKLKIKI